MYKIEHSSTGLNSDWEQVPESTMRPTMEQAKEDARVAWAHSGADRDWVRVIREGARRPVLLFMGGRYRLNAAKWQRVPSRRIG